MSIVKTQYLGGIFQKNDNFSNEEKKKNICRFSYENCALLPQPMQKPTILPRLTPPSALDNVITTEFQTAKIKQFVRLNYAKTNDKPRLSSPSALENVITTEFQTAKIKQTALFCLNLCKNQR